MIYTDSYGAWKLLGEINVTRNASFIAVPPTREKIIRFNYLIDWNQWDNNRFIRSRCLIRWHYGLNQELPGFYSTLFPKKESNIEQYKLIAPSNSLVPRQLEIKALPLNFKFYYSNIPLLPWVLKVEEYQNG